ALSDAEIQTIANAGFVATGATGKCLTITGTTGTVQFAATSYTVNEGAGVATVTVGRTGDTSTAATVDYQTADGTAHQSRDYTIASGTLSFAAGETAKSFTVLITDNAYVDGNRTINLTLNNPTGGLALTSASAAVLTVLDNDTSPPTTNPLDQSDARF